MNHWIKESAIGMLGALGAYPARGTAPSQIHSLIARLRPVMAPGGLVRMGGFGDGGYLLPDDFEGVAGCFSPGASTMSEFERRHVGALTDVSMMTLDHWVDRSGVGPSSDLFRYMDIEGAEYQTLEAASLGLLRRFRLIIVEFHGLQDLWNRPWFDLASRAFDKLLLEHACVHIHPNNCYPCFRCRGLDLPCVAEFTFLRGDRFGGMPTRLVTQLPHPLDRDNNHARPVVLGREWYGADPV